MKEGDWQFKRYSSSICLTIDLVLYGGSLLFTKCHRVNGGGGGLVVKEILFFTNVRFPFFFVSASLLKLFPIY